LFGPVPVNVRVVPVIDLRAGLAVHARGGRREGYAPVRSVLCEGADPLTLARAYRDVLGLEDLYVADLDAIGGGPAYLDFYRAAADSGLRLRVDAGVDGVRRLRETLTAGASSVIVATETLPGPETLRELAERVGPDDLIFGLDLRGGVPVLRAGASWPSAGPVDLIDAAREAGVRRFLVLDLIRVGSGVGVAALDFAGEVARRHPGSEVAVGGGVSGRGDLDAAARAGVDAVLVGSALHDGRLTRGDLGQRAG